MSKENYQKFYPVNDFKVLSEKKYSNLSKNEIYNWKTFVTYISKTPYVKRYLHAQQEGVCPICDQFLEYPNSVIHHNDYDQFCSFERSKITIGNSGITKVIANCKNCNQQQPCFDKIVLLHKTCHYILHKMEGRIKDPNAPVYNRIFWQNKTDPDIMMLMDQIKNGLSTALTKSINFDYKQNFINLDFCKGTYFCPSKKGFYMVLNIHAVEKWKDRFSESGINAREFRYKLRLDFNQDSYQDNHQLFMRVFSEIVHK